VTSFLDPLIAFVSAHAWLAYLTLFLAALLEAVPVVGAVIPGSTVILALSALVPGGELHFEGREILSAWPLANYPRLIAESEAFFNTRSEQLAAMSLRHKTPSIYQYRKFTAAGGLVSYGSDETESYRLVGGYAGRILKGDKPGDLPVQQATKVELLINLKTAKALGITVPLSLLGRADEVIE